MVAKVIILIPIEQNPVQSEILENGESLLLFYFKYRKLTRSRSALRLRVNMRKNIN